jgi:hypothetical protein
MIKRTTIYLDPDVHRVLKLKSAKTSRSISELVNEAVRNQLALDQEELQIFQDRKKESTVPFEQLLKKLKKSRKIYIER